MKNKWLYLGLPLFLFLGYIGGAIFFPKPPYLFIKLFFSELGFIENATAVFFMIAGVFGAILFFKSKKLASKSIRFIYLVFFLGSFFVTLEEINYGQFFYNYESGEWFAYERGEYQEINIHKQWGHVPARRMNSMATFGFPVVCVVLPLIGLKNGWFNSKHWGFYFFPQKELILITILAQLATWIDNFYDIFNLQTNVWVRATEFKELLWGLTLVLYGAILHKRLLLLKQAEVS